MAEPNAKSGQKWSIRLKKMRRYIDRTSPALVAWQQEHVRLVSPLGLALCHPDAWHEPDASINSSLVRRHVPREGHAFVL